MNESLRFEALPFDAERVDEYVNPRLNLWMLIPASAMLGMIGWWILVDGDPPWSGHILLSLGLLVVWMWLFRTLWRESSRDYTRYLQVRSEGIDVHMPGWYETFVPWRAIDRIEKRARYAVWDMVTESFAWDGRVPQRGEHVAIFCSRRVGYHIPFRLFSWRMTFRAKLRDSDAFVDAANVELARWRTEHPAGVRLSEN